MGFNGEFPVEEILIGKTAGQSTAVVTLKDPGLVEDAISKLNNTKLENQTVTVSVFRSEKILCVAHLPLDITEYRFRELMLQHGNVDMCFLMRSEETGDSKGYGFVEYNEGIEKVGQIKCAIDWSQVEGNTLHCDAIVDSTQSGITFGDLHSRCLIIDNLPSDYTDSLALRELFSQLVRPIYCQIVLKEGTSLGYGIVEYDEALDAEKAFNKFNRHKINSNSIRILYCIPGKSAVHMFNRIMFKYGDRVHVNKSVLLPDPVYPNPAFLKHVFFKTHVAKHPRLLVQFTDNLLNLQEGYVRQLEDRTNTKPGLLGPAPTIPMSPLMDVNVQLGLLSVIVLDMREKGLYNGQVPDPLGKLKVPSDEEFQQKAEPVSLLGDPHTAQANMVLKNILMPCESPNFQPRGASRDPTAPKLLGKQIGEMSLPYLASLGRMMAMMVENSQSQGILGNIPHPTSQGPNKPLIEGLMQAGKVAQKILNSIQQQATTGSANRNQTGHFSANINNSRNFNSMNQSGNFNAMNLAGKFDPTGNQFAQRNQSSINGNQPQSLLGNPPIMGNPQNTENLQNMGNLQKMGKQNMSGSSNFMNTVRALSMQQQQQMLDKTGPNKMAGLLGNMKGTGMGAGGDGLLGNYPGQDSKPPQSLLGQPPKPLLSLNLNNKGEGLIPIPKMEDSGLYGNSGMSNNDSGYQGGFDEYDTGDVFNNGSNNNFGIGNYGNGNSLGNYGNGKPFGSYGNGNNVGRMSSSGYSVGRMPGLSRRGSQGNQQTSSNSQLYPGIMNQYQSEGYDGPNFSGINNGKRGDSWQQGQDGSSNELSSMAEKAALYAAGAAAAYKHQYEEYMSQQGGAGGGGYYSQSQYQSYSNMDNSEGLQSNKRSMSADSQSKSNNWGYQSSYGNNSSNNNNYGSYGTNQSYGQNSGGQGDGLLGPAPIGTKPNMTTPHGQKRAFSHILPSPEPSPEGDYIGQHSQGIGGHYADSYKRQKLSGRF
ncbi:uncharacterized protein LOC127874351 isoform X2 [Dreissena polymorpha]|nr:uncharacterized protein LOC127874351 isoform X2 [Dreissena polymorpha]